MLLDLGGLVTPGAPGMKVVACQILGKLSTRKRKKGLEWITFDDIMMTGKINGVIRLLPKKQEDNKWRRVQDLLSSKLPKLPNS